FHEFFTNDTVNWFEQRNVKLKVEKDGRMFPVSDSSSSIINCLVNEANIYGVDLRLNTAVTAIRKNEKFEVHTSSKQVFTADYVCLACGGYQKSAMYHWLNELGHTHADPVPSLFTFNLPQHPIVKLMGVSVEKARVKIEGTRLVEEGPLLITHWGLSGPAILRLSAWGARLLAEKNYAFTVHINWLPEMNEQTLRDQFRILREGQASKKIINLNMGLAQRLWEFLLEQSTISAEARFADISSKSENLLIKNLVDYIVTVKGKTTFKEEFVTAGGISLNEVDAHTMMSRKMENLFFAGEILDVDGITGGFNFQHAWTSGFIAARSVVLRSRET
ncbi:MAG: aminoacetone oxidase family FAD-binding enzyme, partial [Flavisolibacter sp.]